ncbi:MAG: AMP-binding protein, partial [Ruminococcus sp.]|nr:AMP-binding protein [Candidatus Copronaster equi]
MADNNSENKIYEVAERIREMREICNFTVEQMAEKTEITPELYVQYETGKIDLPFTFIHKCALAFDIGLTDLLEGHSAILSSYTVTRSGKGQITASENGIEIQNLAPKFRKRLSDPYLARYEYSAELENQPIHTTTHAGQEFDLIIHGTLKIKVGSHEEILHEGDSIYYDSSKPHGMIAVGGSDCEFLAMIMASDEKPEDIVHARAIEGIKAKGSYICEKFIEPDVDENGCLTAINFNNADKFNFAFDIVDGIARKSPDKRALVHVDEDFTERIFTFKDIKDHSNQAANYFSSLGIKKGDRVMLVMKRHYQFWFSILALHKIGAIVIPATNQLVKHDFEYRFEAAGVSAIICTADGDTANQVDLADENKHLLVNKIVVNGKRDGWHSFDDEYHLFSRRFRRSDDTACGDDPMLMFFTSGTTGYPKIAAHSFKYPLGHYITAKYWHCVSKDGLHFTISDTGWGKALWVKLYGQWLCEGAVFA